MTKQKQAERTEAIEQLKTMIEPGDTIYTILRHRSQSGMSRNISVKVMKKGDADQKPYFLHLDYLVSQALGWPLAKNTEGIKVGGCGMDMGFHLVYTLGAVLWPKGTEKAHGTRNGQPDFDGGYALKQEWL